MEKAIVDAFLVRKYDLLFIESIAMNKLVLLVIQLFLSYSLLWSRLLILFQSTLSAPAEI
jgi:hypothetical protein